MTGLECGPQKIQRGTLADVASIPYRRHHRRMNERTKHLERSRKPCERARVQSFLSEEEEEEAATGDENGAIGIMGILTAATKPGIFTPLKTL